MANYLIMTDSKAGTVRLTTDHAASSYGSPVLVIEAEDVKGAYGPADTIGDSGIRGADIVAAWDRKLDRTPEERAAAGSYLRQWFEGPQV